MSECLNKKAVLEWHKERIEHWKQFRKTFKDGSHSLNETCEVRIDTHQVAINLIQSGAFDAPDGEVQRLRAIEQAIRDFQPTKEQQAGYDALVAWLESTTPFVLEPIEALSGARKEDQE
jgi:hypothetical protein